MSSTGTPAPVPPPKIVIAVENVITTVEKEVEAGWTWVEGEFVQLASQAKAVFAWVQNEDPQLAAYVKQLLLKWEGQAAATATASAGALGNLIQNEGATIETGVANFAQGVLGKLNLTGGDIAKEGITLLVTQGEGILQNLVGTALAKVLGSLVPPAP
jgi:hypothetical protein